MIIYSLSKKLTLKLSTLLILTATLSSCDKSADPEIIKVSTTPIPGVTPTTPGGGTTTPGGGSNTPGGGTNTPGGGTTTPGTNTGDGGVAIGATNTIIARLGTKDYTLSNPQDLITFEVSSSGLIYTALAAGTEVSEKGFALLSGATKAGVYDIQLMAVKVNGIEYAASQGDGKVKYTTFDVTGEANAPAKKGTLQGTYDVMATDINSGAKARIVGSFNITQK